MKYIHSDSDQRAIVPIRCTFVAAGINVAVIVAANGMGTILNTAFSSVNPLFESVCTSSVDNHLWLIRPAALSRNCGSSYSHEAGLGCPGARPKAERRPWMFIRTKR